MSKLLKLSLYYGFNINVTNCFSGNEKGYVEGSVKIIRNKVFTKHYYFKTYEDACSYLTEQLIILNKYSFIRVENNFYSVPEYLVDKKVHAKVYFDRIIVFSNLTYVCEHKKIDGKNEIRIDLNHYLNTFSKKPGALRNSFALKSTPQLKSIYNNYFSKNSREFIALIQKNKEKNLEELIEVIHSYTLQNNRVIKFKQTKDNEILGQITRKQTSKYNDSCIRGSM